MSGAIDFTMVRFSHSWKVEWSDLDELPTKSIFTRFSTAYNNVVLFWSAEFWLRYNNISDKKFGFWLHFIDGPMPTVTDVAFQLEILQPSSSIVDSWGTTCDIARGRGAPNFSLRNGAEFRKAYSFKSDQPLTCQLTLKIPIGVFSFRFLNPLTTPAPSWLFDLFGAIENPGNVFSTIKVASRDGKVFYCHPLVLQARSAALAMLLSYPPAAGQDAHVFRALGTDSLKAVLQYVYTDQVTFMGLSTSAVIDITDAAEQYGLKPLKEACRPILWDRIPEKPEECFDIVGFASLHIADMCYVKHRAMEVLAANYEKLSLNKIDLVAKFGGGFLGKALRDELNLYCQRREKDYFAKK